MTLISRHTVFFLAIIALLTLGLDASPVLDVQVYGNHSITKRDPCNGFGADFEVGKTYASSDCPPLNQLQPGGACDYTKRQAHGTSCAFFCQVRTMFDYMTEVPIPDTYCRGPNMCSIGQDWHTTTGWDRPAKDTWFDAFRKGISAGYPGHKFPITTGPGRIPIAENECGYFTYAGVKRTVCGSMTEATKEQTADGTYCRDPQTTTGNVCVEDVWALGGVPMGHTIFVRLDCGSRLPLADRQDPIYHHASARMNTKDLDAVLGSWVKTHCDDYYWGFGDTFTLRGRGFKDDDIGAYGEYLHHHINHCGLVADWTFRYTKEEEGYDWYAHGSTPIGQRSCIGSAIAGLGGDADRCTGGG